MVIEVALVDRAPPFQPSHLGRDRPGARRVHGRRGDRRRATEHGRVRGGVVRRAPAMATAVAAAVAAEQPAERELAEALAVRPLGAAREQPAQHLEVGPSSSVACGRYS